MLCIKELIVIILSETELSIQFVKLNSFKRKADGHSSKKSIQVECSANEVYENLSEIKSIVNNFIKQNDIGCKWIIASIDECRFFRFSNQGCNWRIMKVEVKISE